jgi:hypothetical protein
MILQPTLYPSAHLKRTHINASTFERNLFMPTARPNNRHEMAQKAGTANE